MNKEERINYVKDGDLGKVLLAMGLPTLTGMAVNALYNIVDAYFVSGLGTSQLAAVAIILPLIHIIVGIVTMRADRRFQRKTILELYW